MKKLIIAIVFVIAVSSCNDGQEFNGCVTWSWGDLSQDQKDALIAAGIDSNKCNKVIP